MENAVRVEQLVNENVGLVQYVINKFTNKEYTKNNPLYDADDIMQIGMIGLFKAAKSYDENRGCNFSTMAVTCIKNEIYRTFMKQRAKEGTDFYDINFEEIHPLSVADVADNDLMYESTLEDLTDCFTKSDAKARAKTLLTFVSMGYRIDEAAEKAGVSQTRAYKIMRKVRENYAA